MQKPNDPHYVKVTYKVTLDDRYEPLRMINATLGEMGIDHAMQVTRELVFEVDADVKLSDYQLDQIKQITDRKMEEFKDRCDIEFVSITQEKVDEGNLCLVESGETEGIGSI